jgi:Predicted methyltransferase regulatory domain/Methyltransferase domain
MDSTTDWTAGYVTDLEYTHGYYRELCPSRLRLACLSAGIAPPAANPLRYLELGFGQGLSINIHAAAVAGEFWGTDFNPTQTAHARAFAVASGAEATLLDSSFVELAARTDLPEFDIIGLHGIWTWISNENRRVIVDILRRKLKVGGIAYVSYNCFPGWAPAVPLRHLMTLHAELAGSDAAGTTGKIDGALTFARQLADSGALYFRANPAVSERLKRISEQNRNYVAHEYFNRDWDLMTFSDVARWLDDAKLTFVASAHLIDHVEAINLTAEGQKLLSGIQHPVLKQSVRDYFVNQQFRRDIFVKGPCRLTQLEQFEALRAELFVLTSRAEDVPRKVTGSLGEATLHEDVYGPVIDVMSEGAYAPKTLATLNGHAKLKSISFQALSQALLVLTGAGHAHPAQQPADSLRSRCRALNRYLCARARSSSEITFLASPITGGGVQVPRFDQLFILASQQGGKTEADYAAFAWTLLSSQGQRLVKDNKTLQTAEDNIAQLTAIAQDFTTKRLPILKALEVI